MIMSLTGKRRYRVDERGLVILQLEWSQGYPSAPHQEWRDAKVEDLTVHEQRQSIGGARA